MSDLARFGVAMETSLLAQFDQLVEQRGSSRSELLRDLVRAEIIRSLSRQRVEAFASVTIVYNHHVRELSEHITEMQHSLGEQVRSTMHIHLDAERCLEVIVMRGRADRLRTIAEKLFATRGVLQGSIEIVAIAGEGARAVDHDADHDHDLGHGRNQGHSHAKHAPPRRAPKQRGLRGTNS
jgi:CopG family nickel-responsive transcriptional regulator